jgi:hypothetical protein
LQHVAQHQCNNVAIGYKKNIMKNNKRKPKLVTQKAIDNREMRFFLNNGRILKRETIQLQQSYEQKLKLFQ